MNKNYVYGGYSSINLNIPKYSEDKCVAEITHIGCGCCSTTEEITLEELKGVVQSMEDDIKTIREYIESLEHYHE